MSDALDNLRQLAQRQRDLDERIARARRQLDNAFAEAYFDARLRGLLPAAIDLGLHSRKRVLAFTRHANLARGNPVRWGSN